MDAEAVEPAQKSKRTRARLTLVGLFALFFVPIFGAVLIAVVAPHWIPFGRVNHGELLRPAVADALQAVIPIDGGDAFSRGPFQPWITAHLSPASCDVDCEHALVQMRQARLALGKDAHRVERWWLVTERPAQSTLTSMMDKFPGLRIGLVGKQSPMFARVHRPIAVYVVDPVGFLMLQYASDVSQTAQTSQQDLRPSAGAGLDLASALRKDFKRLLKLSRQR